MSDFLTLTMRKLFPGRFPSAPSLRDQDKAFDPGAPDLHMIEDVIDKPERDSA
jgi:hypothetical protein